MKLLIAITFFVLISCTKSETQYQDNDNSKATVNDRKSDTIKTIPEMSDTLSRQTSDNGHVNNQN